MIKYIDGKETRLLKYEEIKALALKDGCKDDKVSVGMWAKFHGYIKTRKQINKVVCIGYYKANETDNNK